MFRFLCEQTIYTETFIPRCDNHPHHYYIQVLAETGLIGLQTFVIMVTSLIYVIWANARHSSDLLEEKLLYCSVSVIFSSSVNRRYLWPMGKFDDVVCCILLWPSLLQKNMKTAPKVFNE